MKPCSTSFLSVSQAAQKLGITAKTVREWCQSGKLPAIPKTYGHKLSYLISPQGVEMILSNQKEETQKNKPRKPIKENHKDYVLTWLKAMARGTLNGKAYSQRTMDDYEYYADIFFTKQQKVSPAALKKELMAIPASKFSKREHYFKAILCLGKFLIQEGALEPSFTEEIKPLYPKRHLSPKRFTVSEDELKTLIEACTLPMDRALVVLLSSTGLRASECCSLKVEDVNICQQTLTVKRGKGGKCRTLGVPSVAIEALKAYLETREGLRPEDFIFPNAFGKPLTPSGLHDRLEKLGKKTGIKVNPHALRRAFVTINANKGRSLVMLQMACGHSNITTTRNYCLTSRQEVIESMKGWD